MCCFVWITWISITLCWHSCIWWGLTRQATCKQPGLGWHGPYRVEPVSGDKFTVSVPCWWQAPLDSTWGRESDSQYNPILNTGERLEGEAETDPSSWWVMHCSKHHGAQPKLQKEKNQKTQTWRQKIFDSQDLDQQNHRWELRNNMAINSADYKLLMGKDNSWHHAWIQKVHDQFFLKENIQYDIMGMSHI